jgi:hypothetical protein
LAASIAGDSRSWRFWVKLVGIWARIFIFLKLALLIMKKNLIFGPCKQEN